jgi:hypothetical protein
MSAVNPELFPPFASLHETQEAFDDIQGQINTIFGYDSNHTIIKIHAHKPHANLVSLIPPHSEVMHSKTCT